MSNQYFRHLDFLLTSEARLLTLSKEERLEVLQFYVSGSYGESWRDNEIRFHQPKFSELLLLTSYLCRDNRETSLYLLPFSTSYM